MKWLVSLLCTSVLVLHMNYTHAQVIDSPNGEKVWYAIYLHKKISARWSIDNLSLAGMRSLQHDFWFFQNNLGLNFKINRLLSISAGYGHSLYAYSPWWDDHYQQKPNFLNTVSFHSMLFSLQRKTEIGRKFQLNNELIVQYYIPKFEKYETRFHYTVRFSYRKRNLPLGLTPSLEGGVYYYLNGVKTNYYDKDFNIISYASPDGIHRFRGKVGINLVPIKELRNLSVTLYYGINREFNLKGFGNNLNIEHPSRSGNRTLTTYPFNNYYIFGCQLNYSF
ncbi:MAG: hypothetical protein ABIR06_16765 [Cyclobacteriaceae bacterium]